MAVPLASAFQWFLFGVQTAVIVKDIQTGQFKSPKVVCEVGNINSSVFEDYEDDLEGVALLVEDYVGWQYGEKDRPVWISFYNGKYA